ncbi:MAG TPA: tripartite tricarboxylate transporter substrate-binding protein [Candidatus Binatia bacterium]|nr:tripartite tricarboxylate transporter substrate-binding protein [Candidatus Binatia bacterium]
MIERVIAAILAVAFLYGARLGYAASEDNFYKGKTIRLIVAFSPGGGYDAYSRTLGRHLGKYIPGNPTILVENMTGAGGIIHANFMYQAKPDGLIIGNNAGGLILQQIMGAKGIEFDGKRFEFLGAPGSDHHVCTLSKASGITSMEKWFASKEPVRFGGVGPGGGASDNARVLQAALGLPIRVVDGYKGTADIRLAAESGELAGACFAWESFKTTWRKGLDSGDFNVILQAMPKKHPDLPNVPLANDYVKTDEGRRLLKHGIYDTAVITRPYFVAPGTPKPRVQMLRKAFAETLKNPEFLAEAKKASLDIQHVSGEEIEAVVQGLFKIEPAFIAKMKQVLVP